MFEYPVSVNPSLGLFLGASAYFFCVESKAQNEVNSRDFDVRNSLILMLSNLTEKRFSQFWKSPVYAYIRNNTNISITSCISNFLYEACPSLICTIDTNRKKKNHFHNLGAMPLRGTYLVFVWEKQHDMRVSECT